MRELTPADDDEKLWTENNPHTADLLIHIQFIVIVVLTLLLLSK